MGFLKNYSIPLFVILAGCAGGNAGVNTLDHLTTSTSNNGVLAKPVNLNYPLQTRFMAINGFLPVSGPGSACLANSFRPSSAIICYSDDGVTRVARKEYKTGAGVQELHAIKDSLQALQIELLDFLDDGEDLVPEKALEGIVSKAQEIRSDAEKNNIFLFRWQQDQAGDANGGLTGLLSGQAKGTASESGIVIVGGVNVSQLLIGRDDYDTALSGFSKGTKIATLTLGAQHLVYFSEANFSAAIAAELNSSVADLSKKLSDSQEIALKAYAAIGRAQENQGTFSAVALQSQTLDEYRAKRPTEQIFYSTLTDVETLVDALDDQ